MKRIWIDRTRMQEGDRPITIAEDGIPELRAANVKILGPSELRFDVNTQWPARVWIETNAELEIE